MTIEVSDLLTPIKFDDDRFRGFRSLGGGQKIAVFHWRGKSPLQQFCTTCRLW